MTPTAGWLRKAHPQNANCKQKRCSGSKSGTPASSAHWSRSRSSRTKENMSPVLLCSSNCVQTTAGSLFRKSSTDHHSHLRKARVNYITRQFQNIGTSISRELQELEELAACSAQQTRSRATSWHHQHWSALKRNSSSSRVTPLKPSQGFLRYMDIHQQQAVLSRQDNAALPSHVPVRRPVSATRDHLRLKQAQFNSRDPKT